MGGAVAVLILCTGGGAEPLCLGIIVGGGLSPLSDKVLVGISLGGGGWNLGGLIEDLEMVSAEDEETIPVVGGGPLKMGKGTVGSLALGGPPEGKGGGTSPPDDANGGGVVNLGGEFLGGPLIGSLGIKEGGGAVRGGGMVDT